MRDAPVGSCKNRRNLVSQTLSQISGMFRGDVRLPPATFASWPRRVFPRGHGFASTQDALIGPRIVGKRQ
jgi:hypothetical protein